MSNILIADSGATKCEWFLLNDEEGKSFFTTGISPYFLNEQQVIDLLLKELPADVINGKVNEVNFYGTGLGNPANVEMLQLSLSKVFGGAVVNANTDLLAAARALCGNEEGIACILGTGSNSCYYNGAQIVKNTASLGYILGDEGSGAYLGKKVLQYYLYNTFDEDLIASFNAQFNATHLDILNNVYKQPFANRYLASFTRFLSQHRGHYMIENILEDGLNDFFYNQLSKYGESWTLPIHFTGSIAFYFKDVLQELCNSYQLQLGNVLKAPMEGLINYHKQ